MDPDEGEKKDGWARRSKNRSKEESGDLVSTPAALYKQHAPPPVLPSSPVDCSSSIQFPPKPPTTIFALLQTSKNLRSIPFKGLSFSSIKLQQSITMPPKKATTTGATKKSSTSSHASYKGKLYHRHDSS